MKFKNLHINICILKILHYQIFVKLIRKIKSLSTLYIFVMLSLNE